MKRDSHILVGVTTAYLLGLPILPAMVGSTLPDMDYHLNGFRFKWKLLRNHRGITHHALLGLILFFLTPLVGNPFLKSFIVGYLSHLVADLLTPKGIPFWKYNNRVSFSLFKTGSISEYVVVAIYTFTSLVFLILTNPQSLIPPEVVLIFKNLLRP